MQLEFRYRFEAAHRFIQSKSIPCMTPHGHTWYATMGLAFKERTLDSAQMSVEFSSIKKDWKNLIQTTFDHSYLHNINDPVVEVLKASHQEMRLIPFPGDPTTEIIALFLFNKMEKLIHFEKWDSLISLQFIRIEETPTNSITCTRSSFETMMNPFQDFDGWWNSTEIKDRSFSGK